MLFHFDIWHVCVNCICGICNDSKVYALGKLLEFQKIRAGMKHMIQSLNFPNEETGSRRGKTECLKEYA